MIEAKNNLSQGKQRTVKHLSEQYTLLDTISLDRYKQQMASLERRKQMTAAALRQQRQKAPKEKPAPKVESLDDALLAIDEPKKRIVKHLSDEYTLLDNISLESYKEQVARKKRLHKKQARPEFQSDSTPSKIAEKAPEEEPSSPGEPVIIVDAQGRASIPGQRVVRYISGEYTLLDMYSIDAFQEDLQRRDHQKPADFDSLNDIQSLDDALAPPFMPPAEPTVTESGRSIKILSSEYTVLDIVRVESVQAGGMAGGTLGLMDDGQVQSRDLVPVDSYPIDQYLGSQAGPLQAGGLPQPTSDADMHAGYYAFLRELALGKLRKMVVELDHVWADEMRAQEIKITRENRIVLSVLVVSFIAVVTLLIFGFSTLRERTWEARFYLKSAWANEEGWTRVIVDAKGLTPEEKYDEIDKITVLFERGPKTIPGEIMPIYLKTGDVLFVIESDEPVAMPGPCDIKVHVSTKSKRTIRTIEVNNLKYEKNPRHFSKKRREKIRSKLEKKDKSWPDKAADQTTKD